MGYFIPHVQSKPKGVGIPISFGCSWRECLGPHINFAWMGILSFWWEDKLRLVRHDFVRVRCWSLCRIIRCEGSYPKGERQSCGLVRGYGRYGAIAAGTTDLDDFCIHLCHFVSFCVTLGIWTITFWSISPPRGAVGWPKIRGRTHVPPMVCSSPCRKSWELNHLYLAIPQLSCRYRFLLIDIWWYMHVFLSERRSALNYEIYGDLVCPVAGTWSMTWSQMIILREGIYTDLHISTEMTSDRWVQISFCCLSTHGMTIPNDLLTFFFTVACGLQWCACRMVTKNWDFQAAWNYQTDQYWLCTSASRLPAWF